MKRTPLKRRGRKTIEWERIRRELKARFTRVGITTCEIGLKQCWRNQSLSFAHTRKRRNIPKGELDRVVLACAACHQKVELMSESAMTKLLEGVIAGRVVQP